MTRERLRAIPSVERVVQTLGETGLPRPLVVSVVRRELSALRSRSSVPDADEVVASIRSALTDLDRARLRPIINATGILVHTNFGRAPLGAGVIEAISTIGASYHNLEYSVGSGARGVRGEYVEHGLSLLCGAEAATVVNNNAAALVLILRHLCRPAANQVVVSRGELVQIGGGFRIPEVLESSGARLREVGTTNQTSANDYTRAINRETALILKVHRSNFFMEGFVKSPSTEEIAALARRMRVPFVEDLGSGALIQTEIVEGLAHEPTPSEVLRRGVDLVCFSGDKLLGGPQAGIIAGKRRLVSALKREPVFRALRCDKLVLAALETTVDQYLTGNPSIPILDMLRVTIDDLRSRADRIVSQLGEGAVAARVGTGHARMGGGTLPRSSVPSITLDLTHATLTARDLAARLREQPLPVIGYIARDVVKLDLRTIFPRQDNDVVRALRAVSAREPS
jgi:L-seryl-tRNA(Ser) seleniumtransferase